MPNHALSTMTKVPLMSPRDESSPQTCVDDLIPNRAISDLLARNTIPNTLEDSSAKPVRKPNAVHTYRFMATIKEDMMYDTEPEGGSIPCNSLQVMPTMSTHAKSTIKNKNNRRMITGSNSIEHMVILLQHGNQREKEIGASVLYRLAAHEENRTIIAQNGGIPPLLDIIQNGTTSQKKQAVPAIASLAFQNESNKELIARAGGILPLLRLIQKGTEKEKSLAVKAIYCLATNTKIRDEISQKGGIELIVGLVVKKDTPSDLKRYATATLRLFRNKIIKPEIEKVTNGGRAERGRAIRKKRSGSTSTRSYIFFLPKLWNWVINAWWRQ